MAKKTTKLSTEKTIAEILQSNQEKNIIKFKLDDDAHLPEYAHDGDMCMDVYATSCEYDEETDTYIYYTGVSYESGAGVSSLGFARSSNSKTDCYLTNGVGVIDCEIYRGKIQFRFKNRTSIWTRIELETLYDMSLIPWWKKIFMSEDDLRIKYSEIYAKNHERYMMNIMDYAPYEPGDRIGQIGFIEYLKVKPQVVDELSDSERGEGGFGSTGQKKLKKS